eukprot:m.90793 g.90793  ORF g.90793 m.90793 type:complete len:405 (+) comp14604_c1_seq12:810-2024(+)
MIFAVTHCGRRGRHRRSWHNRSHSRGYSSVGKSTPASLRRTQQQTYPRHIPEAVAGPVAAVHRENQRSASEFQAQPQHTLALSPQTQPSSSLSSSSSCLSASSWQGCTCLFLPCASPYVFNPFIGVNETMESTDFSGQGATTVTSSTATPTTAGTSSSKTTNTYTHHNKTTTTTTNSNSNTNSTPTGSSEKRRHRRSRKQHKKWKPYTEMTWQERRDLVEREAQNADAEMILPAVSPAHAPKLTATNIMDEREERLGIARPSVHSPGTATDADFEFDLSNTTAVTEPSRGFSSSSTTTTITTTATSTSTTTQVDTTSALDEFRTNADAGYDASRSPPGSDFGASSSEEDEFEEAFEDFMVEDYSSMTREQLIEHLHQKDQQLRALEQRLTTIRSCTAQSPLHQP